ncbi:MAG: hypothetical protein LPK00_03555 [Bacillaceae bacterium]|nr:hypothetical protein [Bacillaceae bacterium]
MSENVVFIKVNNKKDSYYERGILMAHKHKNTAEPKSRFLQKKHKEELAAESAPHKIKDKPAPGKKEHKKHK